jgi:hypothetical protein
MVGAWSLGSSDICACADVGPIRNFHNFWFGIVILLDIVIHPPSQDHALESARFMPLLKKSETAGKRRQEGEKIYWGSPLTKLTAGRGLRRYWA